VHRAQCSGSHLCIDVLVAAALAIWFNDRANVCIFDRTLVPVLHHTGVAMTAEPEAAPRLHQPTIATIRRLSGPVMVLAGQGIQSVGTFLIGALLARFASVAALGDYALGATVLFLVGSMAETLVATPYTYLVLRARTQRSQGIVFGAAIMATIVLTVFGGAAASALVVVIPGLGHLFPMLPAALIMTLLRELIRRRHYAHGEPGRALVLDVVTILVQFGLIIWMIATKRFDASSVFAAMAAACLVAILFAWPGLRQQVEFRPALLTRYCRHFFDIGRWLALGGVCQIAAIQSFSWFLFFTSDARATGAFTACLAISSLPNPFLVGLTNYARPAIIRTYTERGWAMLLRQTKWLAAAFVLPVLLFAAIAIVKGGWVLTLIYGPALQWAAGSLSWTILALVAIAAGAPLQLLMLAIHRPQAIFHLHVGEVVATYVIGLPLVIWFGLIGAAIGYMMTALAGAAVLLALFLNECRRRARTPATGTESEAFGSLTATARVSQSAPAASAGPLPGR